MKKGPTACDDYLVSKLRYLSRAPPNGWEWHNAFFKMGRGEES